LRYLADLGLTPGTVLKIVAIAPFEGPVSVQIGVALHALDQRLAHTIYVER
jgi:DtxR family transcriptional regulator, Mn-dependent transcriptional regulator